MRHWRMDFRRGLVVFLLCLSLIAAGRAASPVMAADVAMQADCPAMQEGMRADDASSAPASPTHRNHGCCHDGACHCAGAHGVAVIARASRSMALQVVVARILRAPPDPYVSPTLSPPVRPPIA